MRKLDAVFFENNIATVAQEKEASFFYCSTGIACGTMCFHQASAKGG